MLEFDVVIVGGGPSGAFLAGGLAADGLKVAVVDKACFPREKVCGGGISNKTLALLPTEVRESCVRSISGAILTYRNTRHLEKNLGPAGGGTVLREELDFALLQRAIDLGAAFFGEAEFQGAFREAGVWVSEAGGQRFRSPILVGADGVFSQVRHRLFGRDLVKYTPAVEAHFYCGEDVVQLFGGRLLFDLAGMPKGYGWIFPKADHLNVGVYSIFDSQDIRGDFTRFVESYPLLKRALRIRRFGHAIPVRNVRRQYEKQGCLLVGDAGGFAEPFYGEGIFFALKSADCARRAIGAFFSQGREGEYSRLVQREVESDLAYSLRNSRLYFSYQELGFRLLAENSITCEWFAQLIHGGMSHREVFLRTVLGAPVWALSRKRTKSLSDASWLVN